MTSRQQRDRLRNAAHTRSFQYENPSPCDHCCERNKTCLIMPSGEGKCAECERRGRPCVSSSWVALDRAGDNLSSKIAEDEGRVERLLDELDEVRRRLVRNRKVQEQNNKKASDKWECLVRETAESGEPAQFEDFAATDFGFQLEGVPSPFQFGGFANFSGTETGVAGSS